MPTLGDSKLGWPPNQFLVKIGNRRYDRMDVPMEPCKACNSQMRDSVTEESLPASLQSDAGEH